LLSPGNANGLQVDHLVEALDVQGWDAGGGRGLQGVAASAHNSRCSWWPSPAAWRAGGLLGTDCDSRMLVSV
jgi:hypothetical protein